LGTPDVYETAKLFVDDDKNQSGLDIRRYIHGITPWGERRVPVTVAANNDGIGTSIIMYAINGRISENELAELLAGKEEKDTIRSEIDRVILSAYNNRVDVSYERHSNGRSVVYAMCPDLYRAENGDQAVQILGGLYRRVIEEAETKKATNETGVRLCLLVKGEIIGKWGHRDVRRKLTVLALHRAFEEYRNGNTPKSLKYELYTGSPDSRQYKEDILNVVLPDIKNDMMQYISSEIPQEDINRDATEQMDGVIDSILQGAQEEKTEQEALELAQKSKRDQAARVQAQKEKEEMANQRLREDVEKGREERRLREEEEKKSKKRAAKAVQASKEQASRSKEHERRDYEDDRIQDLSRLESPEPSEEGDRSYTGDDSAMTGARKDHPSLSKIRRQRASEAKPVNNSIKNREAVLARRRGLRDIDEKSLSEFLPGLDTEDREPEIPETVPITMDKDTPSIPKLGPISDSDQLDLEFFTETPKTGDQGSAGAVEAAGQVPESVESVDDFQRALDQMLEPDNKENPSDDYLSLMTEEKLPIDDAYGQALPTDDVSQLLKDDFDVDSLLDDLNRFGTRRPVPSRWGKWI
jgi:hypothetical protein